MNNEKNIFEVAARNKSRFPFKGLISVEDLWDLSVKDLDLIFKSLNAQIKKVKEESLLDTKTKDDEELEIKIEIVKYIVTIKLTEEKTKLQAKEQKEKKQKIMEILSVKKDADLQNKSVEELQAMLSELND
jgi:hypothetical protein